MNNIRIYILTRWWLCVLVNTAIWLVTYFIIYGVLLPESYSLLKVLIAAPVLGLINGTWMWVRPSERAQLYERLNKKK